jgi:hypothetical protein
MNLGRKQYMLGSLMIVIAILAVGCAYPQFSGGLLIGGVAPLSLFLLLTLLHHLLTPPYRLLAHRANGWVDRFGKSPANNRARRQYTLGTLMVVIAILAVCFAYPELTARLLIMIFILMVSIVIMGLMTIMVVVLIYCLLIAPWINLLGSVDSWLDSRASAGPPAGHEL